MLFLVLLLLVNLRLIQSSILALLLALKELGMIIMYVNHVDQMLVMLLEHLLELAMLMLSVLNASSLLNVLNAQLLIYFLLTPLFVMKALPAQMDIDKTQLTKLNARNAENLKAHVEYQEP
jgi:hypothetical protein